MELLRLSALPKYTTDLSRKDLPKWSGSEPVPAIGDDVVIRFNRIGPGKVVGYGVESGYLGLMVYPLEPPQWWVEQNGNPSPDNASLTFGAEVRYAPKRG